MKSSENAKNKSACLYYKYKLSDKYFQTFFKNILTKSSKYIILSLHKDNKVYKYFKNRHIKQCNINIILKFLQKAQINKVYKHIQIGGKRCYTGKLERQE